MSYAFDVLVDWNGDGDFGDANEDISADVIEGSCRRGRDRASQLTGRSTAGSLTLRLRNDDGKYSSFQSTSALYGNILPKRKVLVRDNATTTAIWTGFLEKIEPVVSTTDYPEAVLTAVGPLAIVNAERAYSPPQSSILTGDAVGLVLDDVGWPAADRTIDSGETTMAYWYVANKQGMNALADIEVTEMGFVRELANGNIAFESRHHRLQGAHLVSQATFSDASGATLPYASIEQADPLAEIYNIITATVKDYTVAGVAVLWTLQESGANSPPIGPGETVTYEAQYPLPDSAPETIGVETWTTPVATTDYTANTQAGGGGTDLTASLTVTVVKAVTWMRISITNDSGSIAYLTLLQARGTAVTATENRVQRTESSSVTKYGRRSWPSPAEFLPDTVEAHDHIRYIGALYREPIPMLSLEFLASKDATSQAEAITRDVSDRLTLVADNRTALGINEDFFVEAIEHRFLQGREHWARYELSPVTALGKVLVLDTGPGLDEAILGY